MKFSIRLLYLYLFSAIGLIIAVMGAVQLVDLGIKVYVFDGADVYEMYDVPSRVSKDGEPITPSDQEIEEAKKSREKEVNRQRQRQASTALAMLIVGIPLYKYHWSLIKNEGSES